MPISNELLYESTCALVKFYSGYAAARRIGWHDNIIYKYIHIYVVVCQVLKVMTTDRYLASARTQQVLIVRTVCRHLHRRWYTRTWTGEGWMILYVFVVDQDGKGAAMIFSFVVTVVSSFEPTEYHIVLRYSQSTTILVYLYYEDNRRRRKRYKCTRTVYNNTTGVCGLHGPPK